MIAMSGATPMPASVEELEGYCISVQLGHPITARSVDDGIEITLPRRMESLLKDLCDKEGHAEYVVQMSGQLYVKVKMLPGQSKDEGHFSDGQIWPITHKFV